MAKKRSYLAVKTPPISNLRVLHYGVQRRSGRSLFRWLSFFPSRHGTYTEEKSREKKENSPNTRYICILRMSFKFRKQVYSCFSLIPKKCIYVCLIFSESKNRSMHRAHDFFPRILSISQFFMASLCFLFLGPIKYIQGSPRLFVAAKYKNV